jgi:hypothetical protein
MVLRHGKVDCSSPSCSSCSFPCWCSPFSAHPVGKLSTLFWLSNLETTIPVNTRKSSVESQQCVEKLWWVSSTVSHSYLCWTDAKKCKCGWISCPIKYWQTSFIKNSTIRNTKTCKGGVCRLHHQGFEVKQETALCWVYYTETAVDSTNCTAFYPGRRGSS